MNFQNPSAFLWLLPLGGVIVALYLLRMRRKDVVVPATFLWPQRTDEIRANSLFQKLKFNWLMVLQLLAMALMVFCLARWQAKQTGLTGAVTVVVVDTSASMNTKEATGTRFQIAMDSVKAMVGSMQGGDQLAMIEAGPTPRVVFPLGNDPDTMRRALDSVRPTDAEADVSEALRLAAGLVGQTPGAKIVLVSDGCFEPVRDFSPGEASLKFAQVGETSRNVAIQSLGTSESPQGTLAYVGLKNYSLRTEQGSITLYGDGKPFFSQVVAVGDGKSWGKTVNVPAGTKLVEAKLKNDDALQADNYAAAPVGRGTAVRVLLVTAGDVFLERALALDPRVTLDKAPQVPETEKAGSAGNGVYDLVVFDGTAPVPVKARTVAAFGAVPAGMSVKAGAEVRTPKVVDTATSPLMDGVDFGSVYVDKARFGKVSGTARALVETGDGALVAASDGPQRKVYVGFEIFNSDFPLQYSFPIFISNLLDYSTTAADSSVIVVRTGRSVGFPADGDGSLNVKAPDGQTRSVKPVNGRYVVRNLDEAGIYSVGSGAGAKPVYVTLQSDRESRVNPEQAVQIGGGKIAAQKDLARYADMWRPAALLALLVLAGEWWFFARRS